MTAWVFYPQCQIVGETLRTSLVHSVMCLSILLDRKPGVPELLGLREVRQTLPQR